MTKTDFQNFVKENDLKLQNRNSRKLTQEINRKLKRKK